MLKSFAISTALIASSLLVAGELPCPSIGARSALTPPPLAAHPGEKHHAPTRAELAQRALAATKRSTTASKCSSHIAANRRARRAKRDLAAKAKAKRDIDPSSLTTASYKGYSTIQNDTCVLAPDVTEGPCAWRGLQRRRACC